MKALFQARKIQVKESPVHGWGVFAAEDIENNELIEECAFVELPIAYGESSSLLIDYRFNYPAGPMTPETKQVAVLGYGMLYNHRSPNNAYWITDTASRSFKFYSCAPIKAGEEIFLYYGGEDYWKDGRSNTKVK